MVHAKTRKKPIRILCLDGGGSRGIIAARILQEFEEKTGKSAHELFDIILGTSTGGIGGLALTIPDPENPAKAKYSAKEGVDFFLKNSSKIFPRSWLRKFFTVSGLFGARYNRKHLDGVLEKFFGDTKLADALCPVGVLSFSLEKHAPILWSSFAAKKEARKNHYMRDAAGVTSAAPSYFAPKVISSGNGAETLSEVDGGIYANNPALASFIALKDLYPNYECEDLLIVSVGTGKRAKEPFYYRFFPDFQRLIGTMMKASSQFVDVALTAMLPKNYYDLQVELPAKSMPMDNGNEKHLRELIKYAEQLLVTEKDKIAELLKKLTAE